MLCRLSQNNGVGGRDCQLSEEDVTDYRLSQNNGVGGRDYLLSEEDVTD